MGFSIRGITLMNHHTSNSHTGKNCIRFMVEVSS